jgi:NitT/TauT family transport system permease protein
MGERMLHSIRIVFGGFLLSCLFGVPLGILCGVYSAFSKLFEPFVDFFRYMPAPAFGTLLVAVFLAHDAPKTALVFLGTFFQMVLIVSKTTRTLDKSLLEAAQTLGAKPRQLLGRVVIPGILPDLYNDLRILLGWSWTWLVIAELIGVKSGLTEFIETQGRFRNFDRVFPVIIMIGLLGFFTDQILAFFRAIFFPYAGKPPSGPARLLVNAFAKVGRFFGEAIQDRIDAMPRSPRTTGPSPSNP